MTTHQLNNFRVLQIDHVELFVPDRHEAAGWYQRILGLDVVPALQAWAADPGGPLMISSDGGSTKLALFQGQPQELRPTAGFHRVAFRVSADAFIYFLWRLENLQLKGSGGSPVTLHNVVDHEKAFSIYFCDPYGHHLELTAYECEPIRAALPEIRKQAG